jgi:hypothetical protein
VFRVQFSVFRVKFSELSVHAQNNNAVIQSERVPERTRGPAER